MIKEDALFRSNFEKFWRLNMTSFSSIIRYPNSFDPESFTMHLLNSSLEVKHSHPTYSYIVEHFEDLVTPAPDQTAVEKIQQLLLATRKCLGTISCSSPLENPTKENGSLRQILKGTVEEDKNILRFLETVFIQLSLKQMGEKESEGGESKNEVENI